MHARRWIIAANALTAIGLLPSAIYLGAMTWLFASSTRYSGEESIAVGPMMIGGYAVAWLAALAIAFPAGMLAWWLSRKHAIDLRGARALRVCLMAVMASPFILCALIPLLAMV